MNSQRKTSNIINSNKIDLKKLVKLLNNELIILPKENVWTICTDMFNLNINLMFKNIVNEYKNITINCLNSDHAKIFCDLNEKEEIIYNELSKKFWPGTLKLILKPSKIVPKNLIKNGYILIACPKLKIFRDLLKITNNPICSIKAKKNGDICLTSIDHILSYYKFEDLNICNIDYTCKYGIDSTILKIKNDNIIVKQKGLISTKDFSNFNFNIKYNLELNSLYKIPLFLLTIIDFNIKFQSNHTKEIKAKTKKYLNNCILIDFNQIYKLYEDLFLGYVDLSKKGDYLEAIHNLYDVIYQAKKLNCARVFITNLSYKTGNIKEILFSKINELSNQRNMTIPLEFIT